MSREDSTGIDGRRRKDMATLSRFIAVYCRRNHDTGANGELCESCRDLKAYAAERLRKCPHDPKPACKKCRTHCYAPAYRRRIREVMKFSGIHFVKRGRLDWLIRYVLSG